MGKVSKKKASAGNQQVRNNYRRPNEMALMHFVQMQYLIGILALGVIALGIVMYGGSSRIDKVEPAPSKR